MSTGEQAHKHPVDQIFLAHEHMVDLLDNPPKWLAVRLNLFR